MQTLLATTWKMQHKALGAPTYTPTIMFPWNPFKISLSYHGISGVLQLQANGAILRILLGNYPLLSSCCMKLITYSPTARLLGSSGQSCLVPSRSSWEFWGYLGAYLACWHYFSVVGLLSTSYYLLPSAKTPFLVLHCCLCLPQPHGKATFLGLSHTHSTHDEWALNSSWELQRDIILYRTQGRHI